MPTDDIYRGFADSALPEEMILAGAEALDEKDPDIDWDSGMVAVLVYRSMLAASPTCDLARVLSGAETGRVVEMDAALNQLDREHDAEMTDVVVKCFNSLNEADAKRVAAEDRATKLEADLQAVTTEAERLRRINSDHCTAVNTLTIDGARLDRRIAELTAQMPDTGAATDVLAERRRQVEQEGWTPEHDDTHSKGELLDAALCYAQRRSDARLFGRSVELTAPARWPWELTWWKPKDERHDLVKAGALIVAEIERLDRALAALQATATVEG